MDCRRQVWSDVARNGDVVRQRLVAASHQARGATPPDSQAKVGSETTFRQRLCRRLIEREKSSLTLLFIRIHPRDRTTPSHGDHSRYALHVYRKEAHPQELCEARKRPAGAVPARDATRVLPRVPAGQYTGNGTQERRPAGRIHVDLPDLEPLG